MGDYEREQDRLQKLWQEMLSDEDNCESEFGDVYTSDEYTPSSEYSSDEDENCTKPRRMRITEPKPSTSGLCVMSGKRKAVKVKSNSSESTSDSESEDDQQPQIKKTKNAPVIDRDNTEATPTSVFCGNTIDQVIEDVIAVNVCNSRIRRDKIDQVIDDVIAANVSDTEELDDLEWGPVDRRKLNVFCTNLGETGVKTCFYNFFDRTPYEIFKLVIPDAIVDYLVEQTNLYAQQTGSMRRNKTKPWVDTKRDEMEKFVGILIWMGLMKLPQIRNYWSKNVLYETNVGKIMPRNRFEQLLKMWHFNNNQDGLYANDRLRKVRPLIEKLNEQFQKILIPGEVVCIDETLVPFRGRLMFRQFIKNKRHKFGIKLYKLCTEKGYTYKVRVYSGTDASSEPGGATKKLVIEMMDNLLDSGRTLFTDNYYTSVTLAAELLKRNTHLVGTIRSDRKYNCGAVVAKQLAQHEVFAQGTENGIVMLKWKDKRDILMLSTKHTDSMQLVRKWRQEIPKPTAIVDYNKAKGYVDLSDQMKAYSHCLRRGSKWYRKLAMELLLGTALVNSFLLFKEVTQSSMNITAYKEQLVIGLLKLNEPHDEDGNEIQAEEHTLIEAENCRKRCAECYKNITKESDRKTAQNKCRRTKYKCTACSIHYCVTCFFISHTTKKN